MPTMDEVNAADHMQICRWYRFLPSPGSLAIDMPDFREVMEKESKIMDRICERLEEFGGFTHAISKAIGLGQ